MALTYGRSRSSRIMINSPSGERRRSSPSSLVSAVKAAREEEGQEEGQDGGKSRTPPGTRRHLSRQQSSDGGLATRLTATSIAEDSIAEDSIAEDSIAEEDLADVRGGDDDYAGGEVRVMAGSCGSESLFGQFENGHSDGSDSMRAEHAWSMRREEHDAAASRAKSRSVHSIAEERGAEEEGENGGQYQGGDEGECAVDDDMENVMLWIKQLEGTSLHVIARH